MQGPFAVGWSWIAEMARRFGFEDATDDFKIVAPSETREGAPYLSDRWLADVVIDRHGDALRFVAAEGRWYVWHAGRWTPDAVKLADHMVGETMEREGVRLCRVGLTPDDPQAKRNIMEARRINSAYARTSVRQIVEADPRIAIRTESFDSDPDVLNTPGGIVDLKTGALRAHSPAALLSKQTKVAPDVALPAPEWRRFLIETTAADVTMIRYLQRVAGYLLTGSVREQIFWVIWGPGGNGKSVFLGALAGIMGDYARAAPMDTFTASNSDRHPTDLAMMIGARLVTANETQAGRRWDEARMKALTGGDMIAARFMRQDFFTYIPQFKLVFVGNHHPDIRDIDAAMRRRIQIIPFTAVPKMVDPDLPAKLRAEWPAILAWMVEGAVQWRTAGLQPPERVLATTAEYFEEQDAMARWIEEALEPAEAFLTNGMAFDSWREWAGRNGEWVGTARRVAAALAQRGFARGRSTDGQHRGFHGLAAKMVF
jgi:putative DNA primase/helicase